MTDCTVVIVNYNAGDLIVDAAQSALAAGAAFVIVVDNGSVDASLDRLEATVVDPRLSIVRNGENLGFAAACNRGFSAATTANILFLNPDARCDPSAISILETALLADSRIGMVGPLLLNPDGTEQRGGRRRIPTPFESFAYSTGLARLWPARFPSFNLNGTPLPTGPIAVEAISGGCMMVKRSVLTELGGWDEGYFLHVEDIDLCLRMGRAGYQVVFVPAARAIHQQGASSDAVPVFVEWHKHKGIVRFYDKFFSDTYSAPAMAIFKASVWGHFALFVATHSVRRLLAR